MANPLRARLASGPALVACEMGDRVEACLQGVAAEMAAFRERDAHSAVQLQDDFWYPADDWRAAYRPYVVREGVLQIPVKGILLHDFAFALGSWATGYAYIWKAFERGAADPSVRGIALVCDSPGGEVAGNFDLVDRMYALRGTKPVRAFAAESAYSAAYSIASVADQVVVSRTGGVGSIGVVTAHLDVSEAMADAGLKITFIHAGKHKVDGNSYEPLPDDVKARIQLRIDELYSVFVSTVARNRGLEEQAVRDTEALTFTASQALSNKLADAIGPLDDALAAFAADMSTDDGDEQMSTTDKSAADKAAIDAARAEGRAEGEQAGRQAGAAEATAAERARCKAIMASDQAKSREEMATHLAFDSDMPAEKAIALLEKAPKAVVVAAAGNRFDEAMRGAGNPQVGADAGAGKADDDDVEGVFALAGYRPRKTA